MKKSKGFFFLLVLIFFVPSLSKAKGINWQSYKEGLKKGKAENKRIFLNFHADW